MTRNLEAEAVWGVDKPSDVRIEDMVCDGYFPFLSWELFLTSYPLIDYDTATEIFLAAMHRAVEKERVYVEVPPHVDNPRVGSKLVGNIITGERQEYWKADADEIISYFRKYWPTSDIREQALADHQTAHWPFFCFPMAAEDCDPLNKHPDIDWRDYFLFV